MNDQVKPNWLSGRGASFLFHFLLLAWPLLSFLWRRDYPFLGAETALFFLAIGLLSLAVAWLASMAATTRLVAITITPLLITLAVLVQFNPPLVGALACLAGMMLLGWWFQPGVQVPGLPVVAALMLGAWLDSTPADGYLPGHADVALNPDLPPVLHILLDSFIGLDGLPDYPASEIVREATTGFMQDYGFEVVPRAYSRHATTGDSMYSAMNFESGGDSEFFMEVARSERHVLNRNGLFDLLAQQGYRLNIYQTQHLDFCRSHPDITDRCWSYEHPNVATVQHAEGALKRMTMLSKVLLMQSSVLTAGVENLLVDPAIAVHEPRVLESLRSDLLAEPTGRAYFAHLLVPHSPFVYLHDCSVDYSADPMIRLAFLRTESQPDPAIYEYRNLKYYEQMECALRSLGNLFDAMREAGIYDRAIIVLHGDHGSLIGRNYPIFWNRDELAPEDYPAHYSILFAVKFPGEGFSLTDGTWPLNELFRAFAEKLNARLEKENPSPGLRSYLATRESSEPPHVYLVGPPPQERVDINIFEP